MIILATEDHQLKTIGDDSKHIAKVGEIEVKIWRGGNEQEILSAVKTPEIKSTSSKVHEKALKGQAKSHATSYVTSTSVLFARGDTANT